MSRIVALLVLVLGAGVSFGQLDMDAVWAGMPDREGSWSRKPANRAYFRTQEVVAEGVKAATIVEAWDVTTPWPLTNEYELVVNIWKNNLNTTLTDSGTVALFARAVEKAAVNHEGSSAQQAYARHLATEADAEDWLDDYRWRGLTISSRVWLPMLVRTGKNTPENARAIHDHFGSRISHQNVAFILARAGEADANASLMALSRDYGFGYLAFQKSVFNAIDRGVVDKSDYLAYLERLLIMVPATEQNAEFLGQVKSQLDVLREE